MVVEATQNGVVGADAIVDGSTTSPRLDVVAVDRVVIAVGIVSVRVVHVDWKRSPTDSSRVSTTMHQFEATRLEFIGANLLIWDKQ